MPKTRSVSTQVMPGSGGGDCCCPLAVIDDDYSRFSHVEGQIIHCSPGCDTVNFCRAGVDSGGWYCEVGVTCKCNHTVIRMEF